MLHRKPLQPAYFYWLLVVPVHHARAFAQHVHGADARATQTQNVGVENGHRRAAEIAARDFLDEARHVDVGRASQSTRGVEAEQAPIGLGERGLVIQGRMQIGKTFQILRNHLALPAVKVEHTARLLSRAAMKLSTSVRLMFIGGLTRITLPYRPPFPARIRFSRMASINMAVCAVAGVLVLRSSTNSKACIRPMPRTSPISSCLSFSSSS